MPAAAPAAESGAASGPCILLGAASGREERREEKPKTGQGYREGDGRLQVARRTGVGSECQGPGEFGKVERPPTGRHRKHWEQNG